MTSWAEHRDWCDVQSTATNSIFGSSLKFSAAFVNSGLAFLQCPHPVKKFRKAGMNLKDLVTDVMVVT